jgi:predicted nucleic acid-binding protein
MAQVVVDTSAVVAVVLNEPEKERLIELTEGEELVAPRSLHWEVGNALTAMFKRGRLKLNEALKAIREYDKIPIQFVEIDLHESVKTASRENIYAYDAYFIVCAKKHRTPFLSLDEALKDAAAKNGIRILEV